MSSDLEQIWNNEGFCLLDEDTLNVLCWKCLGSFPNIFHPAIIFHSFQSRITTNKQSIQMKLENLKPAYLLECN